MYGVPKFFEYMRVPKFLDMYETSDPFGSRTFLTVGSINVGQHGQMSIRLPPMRFIRNHPKVWLDDEGRHWLLQSSFKASPEVQQWQESADWDESYVLCFGARENETEAPMADDVILLRRESETLTVTVEDMLVPRGFKWAALITINRRATIST